MKKWDVTLAREMRNLENAQKDYEWAQQNASNSESGLMLKQQSLITVQNCMDRVERYKQKLGELGCYEQ